MLAIERHRLTGREYPHLCSGRDSRRFPREVPRWIAERVRPEPRERIWIERAPVDRDGDAWPDPQHRFGRTPWIEMAHPESRPPAPDRQKGDVDRPGKTVHLGTEVGVPREVHARAPGDPVPQRLGGRAERPSSPVVFGAYRLEHDAADVEPLAGRDLHDVTTGPAQELPDPLWHDHPWAPAKPPQGRQVPVIVVRVGDEDDARRGMATFVIATLALVVTAWVLPGITLRDIPSGVFAAFALAALRTLLRPALVAYVSRVSMAVASIVTVFAQAFAFWLISQVGWIADDTPVDALIGSVIFSTVNALVNAVLWTGDDHSFFGTLVRQLEARRGKSGITDEPGVVFIQIDGLAHPMLEEHLRAGRTPNLARWLSSGTMTLDRWEPLLPTQTSASQAGVLHGNNDGIPGFRWWDKNARRLIVSNHPKDAREIMRRVSNGDGLLAKGGASIGNLVSGDATRSFLTAATLEDPAREIGRSHVLDWFFISPYSYVRWTLLSIGEIVKELVQARAAARTEPGGPRGFPYPLARAATNVLLRHLSTSLVIEEMWRGASPIYADFVDYDEIAHHAGPDPVE